MKKYGGGAGYVDLFWPGIAERDLPRFVLVCDFARFRLFDLTENAAHEFTLAELHKNVRLWLVDCPPETLRAMPPVLERVQRVKALRTSSPRATTDAARVAFLFSLYQQIAGLLPAENIKPKRARRQEQT